MPGDDFASQMACFMKMALPPARSTQNPTKTPGSVEPDQSPSLAITEQPSKGLAKDASFVDSLDQAVQQLRLPVSQRACMDQHSKTVSAIAMDEKGSRLVTGSYDYNIGFFDFGGMDRALQPYRYVKAVEAHKVRALRFSRCSQWLLVASSSRFATLLDREGKKVRDWVEGDPYLRDLRHTDGHVAALTTAWWHPNNPDRFMTSGEDGTVRIWNIGYRKRQDYVVFVKSRRPGGRAAITHSRWNSDGSLFVTGGEDGALNLFGGEGPWTRPAATIGDAHRDGTEITCLAFDNTTGHRLTTRSTDGTLKLWDVRNFSEPMASTAGLPNSVSETVCLWSPDDSLVVTGTSASAPYKKGEARGDRQSGQLVCLDGTSLGARFILDDPSGKATSVVALDWNAHINQLVCGSGDGTATVLYDPDLSRKGAILAMARQSTRPDAAAVVSSDTASAVSGPILTPHALPLFRETAETLNPARARLKARKDPIKSHRPELPVLGPGQGGRIGSSVTQAIMAERLPAKSTREEDPREALLKYARVAQEDPKFIAPAYKDTQPKPVLDEELLRKEAEEESRKIAAAQPPLKHHKTH